MTPEQLLQQAKDALDEALKQKKSNQDLLSNLGPAVIQVLQPVLDKLAENAKVSKEDIMNAVSKIKVEAPIVPKEIRVPAPQVTVNVPDVKVPQSPAPIIDMSMVKMPTPEVTVNVPDIKIPDLIWPKNNMPIEGWINIMGFDKGLLTNPLPVQLRDASGKPISFIGGGSTQVFGGGGGGKADFFTIKGFSQSAFSDYLNADGRLRVSIETGGSAITDAELRASAVPVSQVSGSVWTVEAHTHALDSTGAWEQVRTGTGVAVGAMRVVQASDASSSVSATQVGTWTITGSLTSSVAVGDIPSDGADTGSAPVKIGGIARTANPTAVADGDRVSATFDTAGRQLSRPVQVRGLLATAYLALSNGTETSLLAGTTSEYHDLIWIKGSNNSDVAVTIDFRASTGGTVCDSLVIPANGTAGISASVPYPAPFAGHAWTADMGDITGTTVYLTGLFSREL